MEPERRGSNRVKVRGAAAVLSGPAARVYRVENLSEEGVCLAGPGLLPTGESRELVLRLAGLYLEVTARAKWVRCVRPGRYRIGLALERLSMEEEALLRGMIWAARPLGTAESLIVHRSAAVRAELEAQLRILGVQNVHQARTPLEAIAFLLDHPRVRFVFAEPELASALTEEFPRVRWLTPRGADAELPGPAMPASPTSGFRRGIASD